MRFPHSNSAPANATIHPRAGRPALGLIPGRRALFLIALLATTGFGLVLALAVTGRDSDASLSGDLAALRSEAGTLIVYSEFGQWADTIWAADPNDPANRVALASIDHAYGFGITPVLSPDGVHIAYTVRAGDAAESAGGELWLLDVETGAAKRLAQQVDLAGAPVWSPESDAVFVRRSGANGAELVRVELSGAATVLAAATNSLASSANGLYIIDVSPDGEWLYYAVLSAGGTDVARASVHSGKQEPVAHLSDGFSRDWKLSPNGDRLSYLAQANSGSSVTFVAQVLDISTGLTETPLAGTPVAQFNPVWERGGGLTIGQISDGGAASGGAGDAPLRLNAAGAVTAVALPEPASGFDVPLSWSPDGAHLAVRSFEGRSAADPGPSRVVVVRTDGARFELSRQSDIFVAGWLTGGS
ncbi:MAG: hypothetical protein IIB87_02170 [Chloroflexi bacterium]|nr:hypothetical protein [Chloroflexota bacterium]